jgi:hypothetical protein
LDIYKEIRMFYSPLTYTYIEMVKQRDAENAILEAAGRPGRGQQIIDSMGSKLSELGKQVVNQLATTTVVDQRRYYRSDS